MIRKDSSVSILINALAITTPKSTKLEQVARMGVTHANASMVSGNVQMLTVIQRVQMDWYGTLAEIVKEIART
jgi:hypothetical protein